MVAIELAYINTKHPDFHKDAAFVSSLLKDADVDHLKHNKRLTSASSTIITNDSVSDNLHLIFYEICFYGICVVLIYYFLHKSHR